MRFRSTGRWMDRPTAQLGRSRTVRHCSQAEPNAHTTGIQMVEEDGGPRGMDVPESTISRTTTSCSRDITGGSPENACGAPVRR